jgi:hypothetical protein
MSLIHRLRGRHADARRNRAIERAVRSAPTPSARDELLLIAQRYTS